MAALLTATGLMYAGAVAATVFLFIYYTGEDSGQCKLHEFFISINLIISVMLSVVSIIPKVQEHMPQSGLLQSSLMTLYIVYLTWSAISSSPRTDCKPYFSIDDQNNTTTTPSTDITYQAFDAESIVGLVVW